MEIKIKDEEKTLIITDEGFDSPLLWLRLKINDGSNDTYTEIEVEHRALMAACIAYRAKREQFEEEVKD